MVALLAMGSWACGDSDGGGDNGASNESDGGTDGSDGDGSTDGGTDGGSDGGSDDGTEDGSDGGTDGDDGSDGGTGDGTGTGPGAWWQPQKGMTWDWQLSGVDTSNDVDAYDIDWEIDGSTVQDLDTRGIQAICYVSVGSYEDWRSDAAEFEAHPEVLGNDYYGWPGEKFIDIRSPIVREIMAARFETCASKGFDAIEPDNQDVYEADSGFPLTRADGLEYAQWLAEQAHSRGMAIVQKNAPDLAEDLFDLYDGALTEDCFDQGNWCGDMDGYLSRGKPLLMAEYTDTSVDFADVCAWAETHEASPIYKNRDLDTWVEFCP
jgi:endo-alpha-1,4-polygalactosaminidase (GH114 family)